MQTFAPSSSVLKSPEESSPKLRLSVSHHAVIKIRFQTPAAESLKEVTITSRNVCLLSCKCLPNSLVLPPYSAKAKDAEQDNKEGLTWLGISKRGALSASGLEECTCFSAKIFIHQPTSKKTEVPQAVPTKLASSSNDCTVTYERV